MDRIDTKGRIDSPPANEIAELNHLFHLRDAVATIYDRAIYRLIKAHGPVTFDEIHQRLNADRVCISRDKLTNHLRYMGILGHMAATQMGWITLDPEHNHIEARLG